jgi:hypothetical protein
MSNRDFVPPPWRAFPGYTPPASPRPVGWTQHGIKWLNYFRSLKPNERELYEDAYPGPHGWESFYPSAREEIEKAEPDQE